MEKITIRQATPADVALLQKIGRETFFETFAASNTEEDMNNYLSQSFADEKLQRELSDPHAILYFALDGMEVVGYLKVNFGPSQTELKDDRALEIERIYVLSAYHGRKVGQLLYDQAIGVARSHGLDYVWLGVWERNPRAIRFYQKNGFVPFDKHVFKLGDDEQTDILMKLKLG